MFFHRVISGVRRPIGKAAYLALEGKIQKQLAKLVSRDRKGGEEDRWSILLDGLETFSKSGETPFEAYVAMRQLHMQTKSKSDGIYTEVGRSVFPASSHPKQIDSLHFGLKSKDDINRIMGALRIDGLVLLPSPLSASTVDAVLHCLDGSPVTDDQGEAAGNFPRIKERPRVFFDEEDLLKSQIIRALVLDPLLIAIARRQLLMEPIFESVSVFHTSPHNGDGIVLSSAAQMYHIDRDRFGFLNFFIYLNDIDEERGPHWFVKTSHRDKPDTYWQDRRFEDKEIMEAYSEDKIVCVTAASGTTFAANTSAFHKGSPPKAGARTVLQIRYAVSLFGEEARWRTENPFTTEELSSLSRFSRSRLLVRFAA